MKKKSVPRLCIDRVIPLALKAKAAALARQENPANASRAFSMMSAGVARGISAHPLKMALFTGKRWKPGRTLGIKFLDGSARQRSRTEHFAKEWLKYANLGMKFNAGSKAEIRISFQADPGSWSAVGTDSLLKEAFPSSDPTMNYGWLADDTDDEEFRRVVVHEFGHALAAIHEHQNPRGGIKWNVRAVYNSFSGPPNNWSTDDRLQHPPEIQPRPVERDLLRPEVDHALPVPSRADQGRKGNGIQHGPLRL